jgi:DNA-binding transcriptional MocR family regulator
MKIAKPLLLVSTPLGVAWGLLEAYRLAGGLAILMAAMIGALVPDERKRELVELLNKHDIPIIEDDVYAELFFGRQRPKPLKAFDRKGLVLNCNSFSKSLAPGYRVGWVAAGRFATALQRRKLMSSLSTSAPAQDAIALYLRDGGYERHLSTLRRALAKQQATALESLVRHLPANVRISRPEGGYFLWLEMPESQDAIEIHRRALGKLLSHPQLSSSAAAR